MIEQDIIINNKNAHKQTFNAKLHPIQKALEKFNTDFHLVELIRKYEKLKNQKLSKMEIFLIGQLHQIYLFDEVISFWEVDKILKFTQQVAIKEAKDKKTIRFYPNLSSSFPNIKKGIITKKFTSTQLEIEYHTPKENIILYKEIYLNLLEPKKREDYFKLLHEFAQKYDVPFKYLKRFGNRICQPDLKNEYVVCRETIYQGADRLGFYIYEDQNEFVVFHIGENNTEAIKILTYLSKNGLSPILFEQCFINSGFLNQLGKQLQRLRDRKIIIQETYLSDKKVFEGKEKDYNIFRIKVYFFNKFKSIQRANRINGPWILQIERSNSIIDSETEDSEKFNKLHEIILKIMSQDYLKIYEKAAINNFYYKIIMNITKITRKFDNSGQLIGYFEPETDAERESNKYLFHGASCSKGFFIYDKKKDEFGSNPSFFKELVDKIHGFLDEKFYKSQMGTLNHRPAFETVLKWYEKNFYDVEGGFGHPKLHFNTHYGLASRWIEIDCWIKYTEIIDNYRSNKLLLISEKFGGYNDIDIENIKLVVEYEKGQIETRLKAKGYQMIPSMLVEEITHTAENNVLFISINEERFNYKKIIPDRTFDTGNLEVMCKKVVQDFNKMRYSSKDLPNIRELFISAVAEYKIDGECGVIITDDEGVIYSQVKNTETTIQAAGSKGNANLWKLPNIILEQFKKFPNSTFKVELLISPGIKEDTEKNKEENGYVDLDEDDDIAPTSVVILDVYRFKGTDYTDPKFANAIQRRELLEKYFRIMDNRQVINSQLLCIPKGLKVYNTEKSMKDLYQFIIDTFENEELYPVYLDGIFLKFNDYSLRKKNCEKTTLKIKSIESMSYDLLLYAIRKAGNNQIWGIFVTYDDENNIYLIGTGTVAKKYLYGIVNPKDTSQIIDKNVVSNIPRSKMDWIDISDFDIRMQVQFSPIRFTRIIQRVYPIKRRSGYNYTGLDSPSTFLYNPEKGWKGIWIAQEKIKEHFKNIKRKLFEDRRE
ncbi:MAG: hypothetical protein EAX96_06620 [Candidatus Lokiarchaeota archaeon]|nr:hypothetical protein [Candidatus Lokiarchaeota archaeon]